MHSNCVSSPCSCEQKPTSRICVSADDAAKLSVGDSVSLTMSGTVKGIASSYDEKDKFEIVVESPVVEVTSEKKDEKKETYATMPKEDLKKKISKSDEE